MKQRINQHEPPDNIMLLFWIGVLIAALLGMVAGNKQAKQDEKIYNYAHHRAENTPGEQR